MTIKGVGLKTVVIILGETQGFVLIKNQRQLTSYCGYDVVARQSGTSINGQTRTSKKGNGHIRSAMHFPAMVASRYNPKLKEVYQRIIKAKKVIKIGVVALQRRLLILIYSLWKNNLPYIENYNVDLSGYHSEEAPSSLSTRRVETNYVKTKVDGKQRISSTQNEYLYDQSSEVLLR